ncbi:MAG: DEAD/DEAH box helicase [Patescibacteria group bacterium]
MSEQEITPTSGFTGLGINPTLLSILHAANFVTPSPIQAKAVPVAIEGQDVIGIAQTGTGKTLAFGIPMIQRLAMFKGRGLVLVPTRELAIQVEESLRRLGAKIGMRTVVLIGGENIDKQKRALRTNPHVLIATPGRLIDHMEQRTVNLSDIKILVLDEADRMLDMGFAPQINKILITVPKDRQTMLFSATMPQDIVKIATSHMKLPVRIEVAPAGTAAERVEQELFIVERAKKRSLLATILAEQTGTVLVFTRTKFGAKQTCKAVQDMGHTAAEIHSNRSLAQRRQALEGFRSGKYRVLIATDIAARGIDVKGISLVINMDLPDNAEDYVHRIGRTGRAGTTGRAMSFATPDQRDEIRAIERIIRNRLNITKVPTKLIDVPAPAPREREERDSRGGRGNRPAMNARGRGQGRFIDRGVRTKQIKPRPPFVRREDTFKAAPASPTSSTPSVPRGIIVDDEEAPAYRYEPRSRGSRSRPQSRGASKSGRR